MLLLFRGLRLSTTRKRKNIGACRCHENEFSQQNHVSTTLAKSSGVSSQKARGEISKFLVLKNNSRFFKLLRIRRQLASEPYCNTSRRLIELIESQRRGTKQNGSVVGDVIPFHDWFRDTNRDFRFLFHDYFFQYTLVLA